MAGTAGPASWQPVDPAARRVRGFSAWDLLIILDMVVVGALALAALAAGPATGEAAPLDPSTARLVYWLNVVLALLIFGIVPFLWVLATRAEPWEGTLRWLRIKTDSRHNNWYWLGMGSLAAVGLFVAWLALVIVLTLTEVDVGGDPGFYDLTQLGGWPLVIAVSLGAGIGEEILFRGVLQRWIGVWGQAAVFAVLHVNQGWIAVAFIAAIALFFGLLVRKGMPLWAVMVAHASYDFILLGRLRLAEA